MAKSTPLPTGRHHRQRGESDNKSAPPRPSLLCLQQKTDPVVIAVQHIRAVVATITRPTKKKAGKTRLPQYNSNFPRGKVTQRRQGGPPDASYGRLGAHQYFLGLGAPPSPSPPPPSLRLKEASSPHKRRKERKGGKIAAFSKKKIKVRAAKTRGTTYSVYARRETYYLPNETHMVLRSTYIKKHGTAETELVMYEKHIGQTQMNDLPAR